MSKKSGKETDITAKIFSDLKIDAETLAVLQKICDDSYVNFAQIAHAPLKLPTGEYHGLSVSVGYKGLFESRDDFESYLRRNKIGFEKTGFDGGIYSFVSERLAGMFIILK
jgi:hypothetical protein